MNRPLFAKVGFVSLPLPGQMNPMTAFARTLPANAGYRDKARYFQKVIACSSGLDVAADAAERAVQVQPELVFAD